MEPVVIRYDDGHAIQVIADTITDQLKHAGDRPYIVVCVGTDRSSGDALAPIIGSHIDSNTYGIDVYGTLEDPVHAVNLEEVLENIYKGYGGYPYIIAIDSCLSSYSDIGSIYIQDGPLRAGSGVGRDLKPFGDLVIKGCVNYRQTNPFEALQSSSLRIVIGIADTVSIGIDRAMEKLKKYRRTMTNYRI